MKMKLIALLFLLFILLVIVAVDQGSLPHFIHALYNFPGGDKIGHFALYGLLAFLLAYAFPRPARLGRISIPLVVLILLFFVALEEYSQRFFSTRSSDLVDLTFSFLGVLAGTWLGACKRAGKIIFALAWP